MASDQQIVESLDSLLREKNPAAFSSLNHVVWLLHSRLGFDSSDKIDLIRARFTAFYFAPHHHPPPPPSPSSVSAIVHQNPIFTAGAPTHPQDPLFRNASTEISFSQPHLKPRDPNVVAPAIKEGSQSRPKRRGGAGGLNKLCGISPELQTIVGQPAMARTEIAKQLWMYIRKNNLQYPSNKRKIVMMSCGCCLRLTLLTCFR